MIQSAQNTRPAGGAIFGFPLRGFGLFSSLLFSFASALFTFCVTTMVAIFAMLIWRAAGHNPNFADTYLLVGLPASLIVLAVALPFFLVIWIRAKILK